MRELDCDFCGGTAAGAYEVLPADLDPSPDEQVRVVLCGSCRETLDDVLAPLLDRLGADGAGDDHSFAADAADHSSSAAGADSDGDDDADDSGIALDIAGSVTAPEKSNSKPGTPNGESTTKDATKGAAEDATKDAMGDAAAVDTDPTDDPGATEPSREEPADFRKVMRFLNNREFPVDRAEVAQFAAGAYDLEDEDVREIFDYAIERGVLVEENGQLLKA
ncbi:hypothetical protein [Halobaculum rubrum]|uniref:hypothetical protein n=1 Tax=Halobaculum rubrum TaxID=2872158 RepID=UPI001CA40C90|nr:hypothetical protein [Halobaculum rubrum]QZY00728.1 hypothetical protein K6T25_06550 [Halobaculum rubrum]